MLELINRNVEIEKLIMRVEKIDGKNITRDEWYDNLDRLNDDELLGLIDLSDEKDDKDFYFIVTLVDIMNLFNERTKTYGPLQHTR